MSDTATLDSAESAALLSATNEFAHALAQLKAAEPRAALSDPLAQRAMLETHASLLHAVAERTADFIRVAHTLSDQERLAARQPVQALLHPLLLDSPFVRRSYEKPLGYAGDYQMVRYILEDSFQGSSAYAQLINHFFLQHDVAAGHRNRIVMLERRLRAVADRAYAEGRTVRVLTIGCGPAEETYRFIRDYEHPEVVEFVLLDFSRETLDWAANRIEQLQEGRALKSKVSTVEDSVYNLAKKRLDEVQPEYDLVICAGLFDYLTNRFCGRVMEYGVRALRPQGTLLVTNVSNCLSAHFMSIVMEWELIYRTAGELEALLPRGARLVHNVEVDSTGTNVVAEVFKIG